MPQRDCSVCGRVFFFDPYDKSRRGYGNRCESCNAGIKEPEPMGGEVRWENKHTFAMDLAPLNKAQAFNRKGNRLGASVLRAIIPRSPSMFGPGDKPASEQHDNKPGVAYTS